MHKVAELCIWYAMQQYLMLSHLFFFFLFFCVQHCFAAADTALLTLCDMYAK